MDLKTAFDSVDRQALWLLFRSLGIPDKIGNLIRELYTDMVSCVLMEGDLSNWLELSSRVRQGRILAPSIFLNPGLGS